MRGETIHIRDPIHGTIGVSTREIKLIDHPVFQRLRNIKQLGFADLAYPGATHTRYSHSLGAMHVATRLFDRLFSSVSLPERVQARFRQAVRLAMMFHDVGHAPLSHTTEMLMPPVGELGLGHFAGLDVSRRASHEDYTLKMVLDSSLGALVNALFEDDGIISSDVAELIAGTTWQQSSGRFRHGGVDYGPALRQLVSSECDADRMDYLQRDSFFSGVSYGKFDADWLIDNVAPVEKDGAIYVGIKSRAIFSFEDFLLSRYHMFATVYLHYTPVIFENMLRRYFEDAEGEFALPADVERYALLDDFDLYMTLRKSRSVWAERIVRRRAYALLDERTITHRDDESLAFHEDLVSLLSEAGVDHLHSRSRSALSKYWGSESGAKLFVLDGAGQAMPIEDFTPLYERYERPAVLTRVFVDPDQRSKARKILAALLDERRLEAQPNAPRAEA
jgi:HD superfamily phosphohydrolase